MEGHWPLTILCGLLQGRAGGLRLAQDGNTFAEFRLRLFGFVKIDEAYG